MSNPLHPLAAVIADAMTRAGLSENATAQQAGIPRETLRRRLVTGDFKYSELRRVAAVLGTTADALAADAEGRAA